MSISNNEDFFATQIAHKGIDQHPQTTQSPVKKQNQTVKQDIKSLKNLLTLFNSYDTQQKGVISVEEAKKIFQSHNTPIDKFDVHYRISMPVQNGFISFDQFLFTFNLCEDTSLDLQHKYELCKKIDQRLVEFLKLLNNYRKRTQAQGAYNLAKKSKIKIQQIRERELERRKKYLGILHEHQISQLEQKQKQSFEQFCLTWDQFMMDYENTVSDLIKKLQQKHETQLKQFQQKTRQELASKVRFSKNVIQLQARQKTLVKLQQYQKAQNIKKQLQQLKYQEMEKKRKLDEQTVQIRCATLKKQHMSATNSLLQNIQKDRNDQIKQRKQDSQKLVVRNKTMLNQINHRHAETVKKIYEALHNLSIDNDKSKFQKRG